MKVTSQPATIQPVRGIEFRVRLPLINASKELEATTKASGILPATVGPLRVLVVDDNVDAAESLSMLLQLVGNDVSLAHDGEQALKMALELRPEVVLLDIGLPKVSGYDVARKIRQQPWGATAMLVAITGWGQAEDKDRSREAGFDHHLVKPVEPDALLSLIEKRSKADH